MNLRQRYWMAGSLLVLFAMGAQKVRAEALPSVAPDARVMLTDSRAMGQSAVVGPEDPGQGGPAAWLARGNQLQRAGRMSEALEAYLQATRASIPGELSVSGAAPARTTQSDAQAKAWLNIALMYVAHASQAIDAFDALPVGSVLRGARHDAARQIGAQRHRAYRAVEHGLGIEVPSAPSSVSSGANGASTRPQAAARSGADAAPDPRFEPYTVDRWIALPRRASTRAALARSAVTEPVSESPLPAMPSVERLQGLPSAMGR